MTTRSITEQVRTIRKATAKASSSKQAAIVFLQNAGIIENKISKSQKPSSRK